MFAKLFDGKRSQVLVKLDNSPDDTPEVRFYIEPDGLGVCSMAIGFGDTDAGWRFAENAFNLIDLESAYKAEQQIYDMIEG